MSIPKALDVKVFVPAKDFQRSLEFYAQLGWQVNWEHDGGLAELELASSRFFLQNYYNKDWAENFMLYVPVENAQAWFDHVSELIESHSYSDISVSPPKVEPHDHKVTYVWDPSGVLLHFAEALS